MVIPLHITDFGYKFVQNYKNKWYTNEFYVLGHKVATKEPMYEYNK